MIGWRTRPALVVAAREATGQIRATGAPYRDSVDSQHLNLRLPAFRSWKGAFFTHCAKAGGVIPVEGAAERIVANWADIDPRIRRVWAQPYTVDLRTGRQFRSRAELKRFFEENGRPPGEILYTPDFLFELQDRRLHAIEVKALPDVGDLVYSTKLERARRGALAARRAPRPVNLALVISTL